MSNTDAHVMSRELTRHQAQELRSLAGKPGGKGVLHSVKGAYRSYDPTSVNARAKARGVLLARGYIERIGGGNEFQVTELAKRRFNLEVSPPEEESRDVVMSRTRPARDQEACKTLPGLDLVAWICNQQYFCHEDLKRLQILTFYCYGGLLAFDLDGAVGSVSWGSSVEDPYPHSGDVQKHHAAYGSSLQDRGDPLSPQVSETLGLVFNIYGRLTENQLVQEVRAEGFLSGDGFWAGSKPGANLKEKKLHKYFQRKFRGTFELPKQTNSSLRRVPLQSGTLTDLSRSVTKTLGALKYCAWAL